MRDLGGGDVVLAEEQIQSKNRYRYRPQPAGLRIVITLAARGDGWRLGQDSGRLGLPPLPAAGRAPLGPAMAEQALLFPRCLPIRLLAALRQPQPYRA